jgi:transcription elongation factor GreA
MAAWTGRRDAPPMASHHGVTPTGRAPEAAGVMLTGAEFAELEQELTALRSRHRTELARRLRDARSFGRSGDSDELLDVLEEAAIEQARIARLEALARRALVIDDHSVAADGRAGLGSTVRVVDGGGATVVYELVGRRTSESAPREVPVASPVGQALIRARAGDVVHVPLPGGRRRTLRVLTIRPPARPRVEAPIARPAKAA